ncbi:MAG: hypothetical protein ACD_33C00002G0021 [uncultured bacterium]|nr:MAG: hypothetical protein ACD_33C00002G0021 [uncultured bacterium]
MAKVCIIVRKLPNFDPVVHAVFEEPNYQTEDLIGYFEEKTKQNIKLFKEKFVEFNNADFFTQVVDTQ